MDPTSSAPAEGHQENGEKAHPDDEVPVPKTGTEHQPPIRKPPPELSSSNTPIVTHSQNEPDKGQHPPIPKSEHRHEEPSASPPVVHNPKLETRLSSASIPPQLLNRPLPNLPPKAPPHLDVKFATTAEVILPDTSQQSTSYIRPQSNLESQSAVPRRPNVRHLWTDEPEEEDYGRYPKNSQVSDPRISGFSGVTNGGNGVRMSRIDLEPPNGNGGFQFEMGSLRDPIVGHVVPPLPTDPKATGTVRLSWALGIDSDVLIISVT